MKLFTVATLLIFSTGQLHAQQYDTATSPLKTDTLHPEQSPITDSSAKQARSYLSAGIQYLSDNVYYGRKDSARIPYLSPRIGYYHKSGLYASGSLSFLPNADMRMDVATITAGYQFYIGNFNGEISSSRYFYNDQSQNVQSEVKGNIGISAGYDFGDLVSLYMDGTLNFGEIDDYTAMASLDHIFYLMNDKLRIDPAITVKAGTANFYESYYNLRKLNLKRAKKGKPAFVADIHDASKFNILSYEGSVFIFYTIQKKLTLLFAPVYTIPVHPAVISLTVPATGVTKTNTEKISNQFYWSFGLSYKFQH